MKSIKESAEEYVENLGRDEPVSARLREVVTFAYHAGAKYALETAEAQVIDDGNPKLARIRIRNLIPE